MRFLKAPADRTKKVVNPRRRAATLWLQRALRTAKFGGPILVLVAAPLWAWHSGKARQGADMLHEQVIRASAGAGLVVREVVVEGRREVARESILESLGTAAGAPLLTLDPETARARLESLPWVKQARVERRWSGLILVHLTERWPMALWQKDGRFHLVDQDGTVLREDNLERFTHLPVIIGEGAPAHAAQLLALMTSAPELREKIEASTWIGGRRWNLRLASGIDVRLPEKDLAAAWNRLVELDRRHELLDRNILAIDLRQSDRLVVQVAPGATPGAAPGVAPDGAPKPDLKINVSGQDT